MILQNISQSNDLQYADHRSVLPHQGSGAGHAIEDAYILGLCLRDFFNDSSTDLSKYTSLCQYVRLPRAQKAQITSRQAGDVYEMQGPDFEGLTYEECFPVIRQKMSNRMKWVWGHDLENEYRKTKLDFGIVDAAEHSKSQMLPKSDRGMSSRAINGVTNPL